MAHELVWTNVPLPTLNARSTTPHAAPCGCSERRRAFDENDILPLPVTNWAEIAKENGATDSEPSPETVSVVCDDGGLPIPRTMELIANERRAEMAALSSDRSAASVPVTESSGLPLPHYDWKAMARADGLRI